MTTLEIHGQQRPQAPVKSAGKDDPSGVQSGQAWVFSFAGLPGIPFLPLLVPPRVPPGQNDVAAGVSGASRVSPGTRAEKQSEQQAPLVRQELSPPSRSCRPVRD